MLVPLGRWSLLTSRLYCGLFRVFLLLGGVPLHLLLAFVLISLCLVLWVCSLWLISHLFSFYWLLSSFLSWSLGWLLSGCCFLSFPSAVCRSWILVVCNCVCLSLVLRWSLLQLLPRCLLLSGWFDCWGLCTFPWHLQFLHFLVGHRRLRLLCFLVCILFWSIWFPVVLVLHHWCLRWCFVLFFPRLG